MTSSKDFDTGNMDVTGNNTFAVVAIICAAGLPVRARLEVVLGSIIGLLIEESIGVESGKDGPWKAIALNDGATNDFAEPNVGTPLCFCPLDGSNLAAPGDLELNESAHFKLDTGARAYRIQVKCDETAKVKVTGFVKPETQ